MTDTPIYDALVQEYAMREKVAPGDQYVDMGIVPPDEDMKGAFVEGMVQARPYAMSEEESEKHASAIYDRWLAAHDAQIRAEGHLEGYNDAREDMAAGILTTELPFEPLPEWGTE